MAWLYPSSRASSRCASLSTLLCAAALALPGSAAAQAAGAREQPEASAPQAAWQSAYARGQWSAAAELLETIPEGSRTAWHWLHLARAREKRGQLVEAFAAYERLREVANDAPQAPGMEESLHQASLESAAVAARIPWAEVKLSVELPVGALVFVDQQWLAPARMRSPYPVNPGWHTFLVDANGAILAARRVHFEEGQSRVVPLTAVSGGAPAPEVSSIAAAQPTAPAASDAKGSHELTWHAPMSPALDEDPHGGLLTAAYVSLGVGVVGAVVGTGLIISSVRENDKSTVEPVPCYGGTCSAVNDNWSSKRAGASLSYTVGVLGLVTGGILWLAHHERAAQPSLKVAQIELEPRIGARGAVLHGRF